MKLYSYIITYDTGAAPNPFHRYCTLAICKPAIRRTARVGDWVIGTGPAHSHTRRKLICAMKITEILPLEKYFRDLRFKNKKPDPASPNPRRRVGDNLYSFRAGTWSQLPGPHHPNDLPKDLRGKNALISNHFFYFGTNALTLPPSLQKLIHTNQGHRCNFPDYLVQRLIRWLESHHPPGIHGTPTDATAFSKLSNCKRKKPGAC